jgi:hypothetical protein
MFIDLAVAEYSEIHCCIDRQRDCPLADDPVELKGFWNALASRAGRADEPSALHVRIRLARSCSPGRLARGGR